MKKDGLRRILLISLSVFWSILVIVLLVNALLQGDKHDADVILVLINGYTMTLQEAVDNNYLVQGGSTPSSDGITSISRGYHTGDEVYVSVQGNVKTLQDAIDSIGAGDGLCGIAGDFYSDTITFGENAEDISVEYGGSEISLQDLINNGDLCCVPETCASLAYECGSHNDGCGGNVNCGSCNPAWLGNSICVGGDVYRNRRTGTCTSGSCEVVSQLYDDCTSSETCSGGSCVATEVCRNYDGEKIIYLVCSSGTNSWCIASVFGFETTTIYWEGNKVYSEEFSGNSIDVESYRYRRGDSKCNAGFNDCYDICRRPL